MSSSTPRVRALIETNNSVAKIRLIVQVSADVAVPWRWDVPYALWASWGTARTAQWVAEQFHHHDLALAHLVGKEATQQALDRALETHRRFFQVKWLAGLPQ